jgi:hypothetical protein
MIEKQTPMTQEADLERPIRKRASQACQLCRLRKIKCDLVEIGSPCHNCQFDGTKCISSISRRSRKYRLQRDQLEQDRSSQSQRIAPSALSTTSWSYASVQNLITSPSYEHESPSTLSTDGSDVRYPFGLAPDSSRKTLRPIVPKHPITVQKPNNYTELPSYIRPSYRHLRPDELEYLQSRGALSLPEPSIRDQLLRSFLLYVNPYLPVLDVQEFLNAIEGEAGNKISLILFQAVMFAGTAFTDSQVLLDAGFEDRNTARAHFFEKVKVRRDTPL